MTRYMVIRRLSDGKFLGRAGFMNEVVDGDFFENEPQTLELVRRVTEAGNPCEIMYVTLTISNVK